MAIKNFKVVVTLRGTNTNQKFGANLLITRKNENTKVTFRSWFEIFFNFEKLNSKYIILIPTHVFKECFLPVQTINLHTSRPYRNFNLK